MGISHSVITNKLSEKINNFSISTKGQVGKDNLLLENNKTLTVSNYSLFVFNGTWIYSTSNGLVDYQKAKKNKLSFILTILILQFVCLIMVCIVQD